MLTHELKKNYNLDPMICSPVAWNLLPRSERLQVLSGERVWDGYMETYAVSLFNPNMVLVPHESTGEGVETPNSSLGIPLFTFTAKTHRVLVQEMDETTLVVRARAVELRPFNQGHPKRELLMTDLAFLEHVMLLETTKSGEVDLIIFREDQYDLFEAEEMLPRDTQLGTVG